MMGDLLALAARVEAAEGPDRELDARIAAMLAGHDFDAMKVDGYADRDWQAPAYTASLDAAMTLVPEGWRLHWLCEGEGALVGWCAICVPRDPNKYITARTNKNTITAALALTTASLRARAAIQEQGQ